MTIGSLPAQDWTALLAATLADRNPKCGTCKHFRPHHETPSVGMCGLASFYASPVHGGAAMPMLTSDLAVCSAWERKT